MFILFKQVFITLLKFSKFLATKCVSFDNKPCMIRPLLIGLNPVELKYYPFVTSSDKCSGSCNSVDNLSKKTCVPSKTKNVSFKVFNMITNRNEAKTLKTKHISYDCKCKLNSTNYNSNQKLNNETCQC